MINKNHTSANILDNDLIDDIERFCKVHYENSESVIHQYSHILRVARGALWFSQFYSIKPEEKQILYLSGLFHDIIRPITEIQCHAETSATKAAEILLSDFDLPKEITDEIALIIKNHRNNDIWESKGKPWHQCVYLADKIWEHMGAYADFRASVWVGELSRSDYKNIDDPIQAILTYYTQASRKFLTGNFPTAFDPLVKYQLEFNTQFQRGLTQKEPWAVILATTFFEVGKNHQNLDQAVKNFFPQNNQQELWYKEASSYLNYELQEFALVLLKKSQI